MDTAYVVRDTQLTTWTLDRSGRMSARGAPILHRSFPPGATFNEKVSLTTTPITKLLTNPRSHSRRCQRRTRVTNRRLRAGSTSPADGRYGMEEVRVRVPKLHHLRPSQAAFRQRARGLVAGGSGTSAYQSPRNARERHSASGEERIHCGRSRVSTGRSSLRASSVTGVGMPGYAACHSLRCGAPPHDLASPRCSHSRSVIDVIGSVARFRSLSSVWGHSSGALRRRGLHAMMSRT